MHFWRIIWTFINVEAILMIDVAFSLNDTAPDKSTVSSMKINHVLRSYTMGLHQMPCNNIGRRCNPLNPRASGCSGVCRPGRSVRRCRMFHGVPYCVPTRVL